MVVNWELPVTSSSDIEVLNNNCRLVFFATGLPKVRFLCGVTNIIGLERWVFKGPAGTYLSRQQLPLKLAWAISIHKSQVCNVAYFCRKYTVIMVYHWAALSNSRILIFVLDSLSMLKSWNVISQFVLFCPYLMESNLFCSYQWFIKRSRLKLHTKCH